MIRRSNRDMIGYKRVMRNGVNAIVLLLIPKGTRYHKGNDVTLEECKKGGERRYAGDRKMRAEKALVLGIFKRDRVVKKFDHAGFYGAKHITYKTGKMVYPHEFSMEDIQCVGGIHFFLNCDDAINWS